MHAIITGASSGIGEALAVELHRAGYRLTLVARRTELLEALAARLGGDIACVRADLSDLDAAVAWLPAAEARHGPVELLVNNAGVQYVEPALGVDDTRAEALLRLNYAAPTRLMRRVAGGMVERGRGAIVNISSMGGLTATPLMADYCASKAALAQYSETLREELEPHGVHVLTVYPGPVHTPMERAAREKLESEVADLIPSGEPAELAREIREAVEDRAPRLIYPSVYRVGYWFRVTSQWLTNRFAPRPDLARRAR
jgi:short-subunit dehydrogenase